MPERVILIGATSTIAWHMVADWLECGVPKLVLVGRDSERTDRVAADLRVRFPEARVDSIPLAIEDTTSISNFVAKTERENVLVIVAIGMMPSQELQRSDLTIAKSQLQVTGVAVALWAEAYANHLKSGTIALLGSVAGDRARSSNYLYGSAKSMVAFVAAGLQHRVAFSRLQLQVTLIKPGPTRSPMTSHLPDAELAKPENVARVINIGLRKGKNTIYAPTKWRFIMYVVRAIPSVIFNRVNL